MTVPPSAHSPLGFGIIGVGMIADFHAQAIAHTVGGKLVGIATRNAENARAFAADPAAGDALWQRVRASLFADRPIQEPADDIIRLRVPARAADAAVVPIAVSVGQRQSEATYVQALYIVIDQNPSPIAAVFRFTPDSGRADIETRVRIEDYTQVRAIAELNTGELFAATRFVKAAGGCSAPAAKGGDAEDRIGRMRLVIEGEAVAGEPSAARLSVMHPNNSGLAMDQFTRHYTPAWYLSLIHI